MNDLAIVMVRHGDDKYPNAHRRLEKYLENILSNKNISTIKILVENDASKYQSDMVDGWKIIAGDNNQLEFSGFQKGIDYIIENHPDSDFLFVTESFEIYGDKYSNILNSDSYEFCQFHSCVAGIAVSTDQNIELFGHKIQWWFNTSFLFFPSEVLKKFGNIVLDPSSKDFLTREHSEKLIEDDAHCNSVFKECITCWLTDRWHSAKSLKTSELSFLKKKVNAIANEHWISIKLREKNIAAFDFRYIKLKRKYYPDKANVPLPIQLQEVHTFIYKIFKRIRAMAYRIFQKNNGRAFKVS